MKAVAYLRVSTGEQAESGAGTAAQQDACMVCARRLGLAMVVARVDDGVGGADPLDKRPGLMDALARLERGDVLVVAKRNRLGRDPIVVAMIETAVKRQGYRVVSAAGEGTEGDDSTSVLMRRIIDAFAEYERLIIKARTRAALVANVEEQTTAALIAACRASGMSLRAIASELTRRGVATKTGVGRWDHSSVRKVLGRTA